MSRPTSISENSLDTNMSFNVVEAAKHDRVQNAIDISQKILSNHKQR